MVKRLHWSKLAGKKLLSDLSCFPSSAVLSWVYTTLVLVIGLLQVLGCAGNVEVAIVTRVVDGDTIVILGGEHVRYIGIDAPEEDESYYYEAKRFNEQMVARRRVKLERDISDRDDFGRLLRYVYVDGIFVNAEMVRNGYAFAKTYVPNTKHQDYLEKLEDEARRLRKGIWK